MNPNGILPGIHVRLGNVINSKCKDWLCSLELAGVGPIPQTGSCRFATGRQLALQDYVGPTNL